MAIESTSEARGRLQQDAAFSMDELVGRSLRRLTAARLEGGEPLCLYVEVDAPGCHRMFLDAGLAVWEDWGGITQDDRELELDDLLTAWCLDGAVVRSAAALTGPRDGAARFEIDLGERGVIVLETIDGELDGSSRVVLRARGA